MYVKGWYGYYFILIIYDKSRKICLIFYRYRVKFINDNKWVIMKKNINCCKFMYINI